MEQISDHLSLAKCFLSWLQIVFDRSDHRKLVCACDHDHFRSRVSDSTFEVSSKIASSIRVGIMNATVIQISIKTNNKREILIITGIEKTRPCEPVYLIYLLLRPHKFSLRITQVPISMKKKSNCICAQKYSYNKACEFLSLFNKNEFVFITVLHKLWLTR